MLAIVDAPGKVNNSMTVAIMLSQPAAITEAATFDTASATASPSISEAENVPVAPAEHSVVQKDENLATL